MDLARNCLLLLLLAASLSGEAADFEYISPERHQELETQFNSAQFSASDAAKLQGQKWSCDMYGVRTRMKVERGVKLYNWSTSGWHNSGAQLVSEYKPVGTALVGSKDRFEDQVKITPDGLLLSRLSLTSPDHAVIAYSVCKTL